MTPDPKTPKIKVPEDIKVVSRSNGRNDVPTGPYKLVGFNVQYWVFILVAISLGAPAVILAWRPIVGLYAEFAAFAVLVGVGLFNDRFRKLVMSAAILPMAAIVTLALPKTTAFVSTTVYYSAILLLGLVYAYIFTSGRRLPRPSVQYVVLLPLAIVAGEILGIIGFALLHNHFPYAGVAWATVALFSVVFAIAEAILFNGLLQRYASDIMDPRLAAGLAILAYTFTSVQAGVIAGALFALIAGAVMAAVYMYRQNLVLVSAINALMKLTYLGLVAILVVH